MPDLCFITTLTTRRPRPNEVNGADYTFVSLEQFLELKNNNELLEFAEVYGNWYGPPKEPIRQALKSGYDAILRVDVQGVKTIKSIVPQAIFIMLVPPSPEDLETRLKNRYTETAEELTLRVQIAREEMTKIDMFDYAVVNENGKLEDAVARVEAIIRAEKCRVHPRRIDI